MKPAYTGDIAKKYKYSPAPTKLLSSSKLRTVSLNSRGLGLWQLTSLN